MHLGREGTGVGLLHDGQVDSCGDGLKDAIQGVDRVRDSLERTCLPEEER